MSDFEKAEVSPYWRKGLNTVPKRWAAVLKNSIPGIEHDVVFYLGKDKKQMSCHKLILSVFSPVFQAMFCKNYEISENNLTYIEVPDIEYVAFQNLVKYAYTGILDVSIQDALITMYAADKYDVPEIMDHCSDLLRSNLSIDNAVTIYQSAIVLNDIELQEKAITFLTKNFKEIIISSEFLQFTQKTLSKILEMDEIGAISEVDLFNASLRWAKHNCDEKGLQPTSQILKTTLGNILQCIRFPIMSAEEFTKHVEPTGILSDKDCYNLFKYFSLPEKERHVVNCIYNTLPRKETVTVMFWNNDAESLSSIYTSQAYASQERPLHPSRAYRMAKYGQIEKGVYQESFQLYFNTTGSTLLTAVGFIAAIEDFELFEEELMVELVPEPKKIIYATFKNPIKLEHTAEHRPKTTVNFTMHFQQGDPVFFRGSTVATASHGSNVVKVQHISGNHFIAAMQFAM